MEATLRTRLRTVVVSILVAVGGLVAGGVFVLALALGISAGGVDLTPVLVIVVSLVAVQGIAFGGVALAYLRYRDLGVDYIDVATPSTRDVLFVVGGYAVALGGVVVLGTLVTTLGVEAGTNQAAEFGQQNPETLLLLVPASLLLIGPGEELLFRGVVQNRIRESFGPVPGIALASLIFAAIHYGALTGGAGARLVSIGILFFPSLVFGTVYELTGNLVVPALVHGAYNATLFTLLYVAVKLSETGFDAATGALL